MSFVAKSKAARLAVPDLVTLAKEATAFLSDAHSSQRAAMIEAYVADREGLGSTMSRELLYEHAAQQADAAAQDIVPQWSYTDRRSKTTSSAEGVSPPFLADAHMPSRLSDIAFRVTSQGNSIAVSLGNGSGMSIRVFAEDRMLGLATQKWADDTIKRFRPWWHWAFSTGAPGLFVGMGALIGWLLMLLPPMSAEISQTERLLFVLGTATAFGLAGIAVLASSHVRLVNASARFSPVRSQLLWAVAAGVIGYLIARLGDALFPVV